MVKCVAVAVSSTNSVFSILHTSLATLPNLTTLKLRSPTTTLLTSFNLPSLLSPLTSIPPFQPTKLNWQHLTKLTIEAKLKTDKFPQGRGGIFLAAQRWADEYEARGEVKRFKGEILGFGWGGGRGEVS
ncbi:uncharacterized protein K444DRAFT_661906 [Hyaloscypha bicolor E]|uniref:Uncharacterized protein n=1 Tax=Hyaloscypha bicolor E TaxID=1095630 RepID=A0A2J6TIM3_9HELO|nr:uncharacterized protein K444DRAFT_661906 [Hyaloscypha bicolor E]PMD62853.1 hypothetical protein K444DRAFT_661906 [Hyaloscypha bicolor E]